MKYFILILFFAFSSGYNPSDRAFNNDLDQPCPQIAPVASIDVEKLSGSWFVVITSPNIFERELECLRFTVTDLGDYQANVTFCEKFNGDHQCISARSEFIEQNGKFIVNAYGTGELIKR